MTLVTWPISPATCLNQNGLLFCSTNFRGMTFNEFLRILRTAINRPFQGRRRFDATRFYRRQVFEINLDAVLRVSSQI